MDDTTDMVAALANIADFYAHESCGQCTPCREGSLWLSKALHRLAHGGGRPQDAAYLLHIAQNIQGRTICAFGEACAWPVLSFVSKFRDEFEARGAAGQKQAGGGGAAASMKIAASPQRDIMPETDTFMSTATMHRKQPGADLNRALAPCRDCSTADTSDRAGSLSGASRRRRKSNSPN